MMGKHETEPIAVSAVSFFFFGGTQNSTALKTLLTFFSRQRAQAALEGSCSLQKARQHCSEHYGEIALRPALSGVT